MGVLRREVREPKRFRIVGFDTEDNTKGVPLAFVFHDGEKDYYFKKAANALRFIQSYPETACFVAHNLEYDIGNLFKGSDFRLIDRMVYASRLLRVSIKFSKNFFLNSQAYFPGALSGMGKLVGLPKFEGNSLSREYAVRDAEIVQVFMSRMQDRLLADHNAPLGVSIGQVSMDVYRRNFLPFDKMVTWNHPDVLKAYYGGRVEMFYKGVVENGFTVVDINSCYPTAMRYNTFPDTSTIRKTSIEADSHGIGKFTVRMPEDTFVPPLPWRSSSGRLFFPTGMFTSWWTFAEVRMAQKMGATILREWESYGTSVVLKPFDDFVDHFYPLREKAKKILETDPENAEALFDSFYNKGVMNNNYGKLAQHKPGNMMTRTPLSHLILEKNPDIRENRIGPFYNYIVPRVKAPASANFLWGVYITSYARLQLLDQLHKVHSSGAQLIYCDTDSVMYSGKCDTIDIGNHLGALSREQYDLGVFRASKGYLLCNKQPDNSFKVVKVACKGVGSAYALDFVVKGMAYVLKPMRLKEALIQISARKATGSKLLREIGINVWDRVKKEMKSVYIKRKGHVGVTLPIAVVDVAEAEATAFSPAYNMEEELHDFHLTAKHKENAAFLDMKVPPDWFDAPDPEIPCFIPGDSVKPHFLSARECSILTPGETWFAGTIVSIEQMKRGEVYKVLLRYYLDQEVEYGHSIGYLSPRYLHDDECLEYRIGNQIEISLASDYIPKRAINLKIEVTDPVNAASGAVS
jgi:hypothetical protein